MFAIMGITGQVGGRLAQELLAAGRPVRAVLRDEAKAQAWAARGCEIALADADDAAALARAFAGAQAVFVLLPPVFDPAPGFGPTRARIGAIADALREAGVPRVVGLSTIGAQATQENLLTQLQWLERALGALPAQVSLLRAAWFVENVAWDIATARATGELESLLQPLDQPVPMVATADVAHAAFELLVSAQPGPRIVEFAGPVRVTPHDLAAALARALGRDVRARAVPRGEWEARFRAQGMANPQPRMRMLDGFNEGWIAFEGEPQRGTTSLQAVVDGLVARAPA